MISASRRPTEHQTTNSSQIYTKWATREGAADVFSFITQQDAASAFVLNSENVTLKTHLTACCYMYDSTPNGRGGGGRGVCIAAAAGEEAAWAGGNHKVWIFYSSMNLSCGRPSSCVSSYGVSRLLIKDLALCRKWCKPAFYTLNKIKRKRKMRKQDDVVPPVLKRQSCVFLRAGTISWTGAVIPRSLIGTVKTPDDQQTLQVTTVHRDTLFNPTSCVRANVGNGLSEVNFTLRTPLTVIHLSVEFISFSVIMYFLTWKW